MASITKRVTRDGVSWRIQMRRQGEELIHRTAATKGEAQEIARALERELDLGKRIVARLMTVAALIARYIDDLGGEPCGVGLAICGQCSRGKSM
jgi:hypothetical protein